MLMEKERIEIVEYGKKMSSAGLCKGTSGNISIYDPETGYMAISPSGIGYFETEPEDVVVMKLDRQKYTRHSQYCNLQHIHIHPPFPHLLQIKFRIDISPVVV